MSYITIPLLFVMLSGCEGIALREQQMAAAVVGTACVCKAVGCKTVDSGWYDGEAALVVAKKTTIQTQANR